MWLVLGEIIIFWKWWSIHQINFYIILAICRCPDIHKRILIANIALQWPPTATWHLPSWARATNTNRYVPDLFVYLMHVVGSWSNHYFLKNDGAYSKLTSISYLVFAGGQTYTREPSLPILRYSDPPPQPDISPPEREPPILTGTYLVSLCT
jgi:hypothetical protein